MNETYDHDFVRWADEQADLLRAGRHSEVDFEHILLELQEMASAQKVALQSALRGVLVRMFNLLSSPDSEQRDRWEEDAAELRAEILFRLDEAPSLRQRLPELVTNAWPQARVTIQKSFDGGQRVHISTTCPFSIAEILESESEEVV